MVHQYQLNGDVYKRQAIWWLRSPNTNNNNNVWNVNTDGSNNNNWYNNSCLLYTS